VGNIHAKNTYPAIARLLFFKYFIAGQDQFLLYLEGWWIVLEGSQEYQNGIVPGVDFVRGALGKAEAQCGAVP
jgi:hypothetical protein